MTAEHDLDRITRAWLDLMPDEAPDRVIDAVLTAVESVPQQRRLRLAGPPRSITMNRYLLIAATAVIGVALLGGAALLAGGNVGPNPTQALPSAPAMTTAPSIAAASSAAATVPDALKYTWIGAPRELPDRGLATRASLEFGISGACFGGSAGPGCLLASSRLDQVTPDTLRFSTLERTGCAVGDVGTYPWSISPAGTVLNIGRGTDDCALRAAAFQGTWYRKACVDPAGGCLGDLEAGTYASQFITPKLAPTASWLPAYGAIQYTVPDGWANSIDYPMELALTPSADYAGYTADGPSNGVWHEIHVFADPTAVRQDAACSFSPDTSVPRTADGIASWLAALPSVTVTYTAPPSTLDGHHARVLDLAVNAGGTDVCPGDPVASAPLFAPVRTDTGNVPTFAMAGAERLRLHLVDLGDAHLVAIVIDDSDAAPTPDPGFQSLISAATPIVESFHFR